MVASDARDTACPIDGHRAQQFEMDVFGACLGARVSNTYHRDRSERQAS